MKINGSCHCGFITYETEIDPQKGRRMSLHRLPKPHGFSLYDIRLGG